MNQKSRTQEKKIYKFFSKATFFSTLILLMTHNLTLNAQVTIGSAEIPTYGVLLELKTQQAGTVANVDDNTNITSTAGGLLLPRVKLTGFTSLDPVVVDGDVLRFEEKLKLAGLMVYNINMVSGVLYLGVYVWNGEAWAYLVDSKVSSPMIITEQPKAFTFYETGLETPKELKFEVFPPKAADATVGSVAYQWYQIIGNNLHARVGQPILGANDPTYTPTAAFKTTDGSKSTIYAQNNGMYRFYCEVKGSDNNTIKSEVVEVAVGCGAKNNLGEWISFMCFNLGATNSITIQQQKEHSIGTFTNDANGVFPYIPNSENVWGDLFQWGRIADGHQKRQSDIKAIGDGIDLATSIGSGYYCLRNADGQVFGDPHPYYQVKPTSSNWYGKFITSTPTQDFNWYPKSASLNNSIDQLWKNSRFVSNDPCAKYKLDGTFVTAWTTQDVPAGSNASNPDPACVESGTSWRMPQQEEWGDIYKGGMLQGSSSGATANTWTWYNGPTSNYSRDYEIRPDGSTTTTTTTTTTTLFLPTSGNRNYSSGSLYYQGANGYYWSSGITGAVGQYLYFNSENVNPGNSYYRASGFALRCIKNN